MSTPSCPPPPYSRYATPPNTSLMSSPSPSFDSYDDDNDARRNANGRNTTRTAALLRWFQLKRYQYEVTFSLYMLTPTEKFIFNSFLFLFLSMIIIAASLYLPEHITTVALRGWFYLTGHGEERKISYTSAGSAAAAGGGGSSSGGVMGAENFGMSGGGGREL